MEPKIYKYSIRQLLFGTFKMVCVLAIMYFAINSGSEPKLWKVFYIIVSIITARIIYMSISYYIPCFRGKTALELDDDKLQFFIKAKIPLQVSKELIYWNEIKNVEFVSTVRLVGSIIVFNMKDGNKYGMPLNYIAGDGNEIYNAVLGHLKR